jgi:hypothetical protein
MLNSVIQVGTLIVPNRYILSYSSKKQFYFFRHGRPSADQGERWQEEVKSQQHPSIRKKDGFVALILDWKKCVCRFLVQYIFSLLTFFV